MPVTKAVPGSEKNIKQQVSGQLSAISKTTMRDFKELIVWQKSHKLTLSIYKITSTFPKAEMYGLTSQVRRASASISANIAEGCGRDGSIEFARFLQIAMGSATELECHLLLARDLQFIKNSEYENTIGDVSEVKRMLTSFIKKLKAES
jgi:four helix bundle protein